MAPDKFSYGTEGELRIIDRLDEFILELDISKMTLVNPETKNKIRVSTALTYDKSHPAYKLAKQMVGGKKSTGDTADDYFKNLDAKNSGNTIDDFIKKMQADFAANPPTLGRSRHRELGNIETGRALLSRVTAPKTFETLPFEQKISMLLASQDGIKSEATKPITSAWDDYAGAGYMKINSHLRWKQPASDAVKNRVRLLDTLFKSESAKLKQPIIVYRGISSKGLMKKLIANRHDTFVDDGFVSTSISKTVSEAFASKSDFSARMKIVVPKGKRAIYLRGLEIGHLKEHEVALPRGTRFKIVDFKRLKTKHGKTIFEVIAEVV